MTEQKRTERAPEFEEFRHEMHELVDTHRREYEATQSAGDAGLSRLSRLRRWLTLPRLSLALNFVLIAWFIQAADLPQALFPAIPAVEIMESDRTDRKTELVVVTLPGKDDPVWVGEFDGLVVQATIAPWRDSSWDRRQRYVLVSSFEHGKPGKLTLWDFLEKNHLKQKVWEQTVSVEEMESLFPSSLLEGSGTWCNGFTFADLEGDGEPEVVAMFHHDIFLPACIRTLHRDAGIRGTYWNWGYFERVEAEDLDQDGLDEIVAVGTNNAFQGPTAVLLDRDHLSGYSMDDVLRERLTGSDFADVLDEERFQEGALARLAIPMFHPEVAAYFGTNRIHAFRLSLVDFRGARTVLIKAGYGFVSQWKVDKLISKGASKRDFEKHEFGVAIRTDRELRPIDIVVSDGIIAEFRRARENGEVQVAADSSEHWEEWLNQYRYFGELASPDPSLP